MLGPKKALANLARKQCGTVAAGGQLLVVYHVGELTIEELRSSSELPRRRVFPRD